MEGQALVWVSHKKKGSINPDGPVILVKQKNE